MKDSFILFTEYKEQVDMLTDEQAGILFKAIFCYSAGEALPPMDAITKMAFSFIRSAMDRADDKYQRKVDANRENGRRGGRPAKNKQEEKPSVEQDTAYESDPEPGFESKVEEETQENPEKPKKPNGYLGFEEKTEEETQKPNGYFQNPPDPVRDREREHDPEPDSDPERKGKGIGLVENTAPAREAVGEAMPEAAPMERFLARWGINAHAIANYSGGKLAGIDWDKLSAKVEQSVTLLQKHKDLTFFVRNYEKILDGTFDDYEPRPKGRPPAMEKYDPERDGSAFAGIVYESSGRVET